MTTTTEDQLRQAFEAEINAMQQSSDDFRQRQQQMLAETTALRQSLLPKTQPTEPEQTDAMKQIIQLLRQSPMLEQPCLKWLQTIRTQIGEKIQEVLSAV